MTIFDLHSAVLADYRDFVASFIHVADAEVRAHLYRILPDSNRRGNPPIR
ncbi:MAG TPA: hypothetical protein GX403_02900 [Rhodocyclaceae bacterium]|nr:hypothetical protein [Rhodocyclaceae bacterium]